jgi:transposase-like protein/transposase
MTARKTHLADPIYHDDNAARAHLEALMWPQGPVCPHCGVVNNATAMKGASTRPGVYKCREKECRKPFTVTVGTVMERSKIPLHKWVLAAHFMASSKKGMSALQLQRMMGLSSYESAWFLFHRLREATKRPASAGPLGGEGKTIEADETYIGGKEKNRHAKDRNQSLSVDRKFPVMVLVERDGEARSFHMASVTAKTVRKVLVAQASRKSHLMTDGANVYLRVGAEFAAHGSTDHAKGEYVREGGVHSNTAESFFAILKRGVYGSFHSISEAHLHRYLSEFDFRYTTRNISDVERAELLVKGAQGRRLMYRQPDQAAHA